MKKISCKKHPHTYNGLDPKEFYEEFSKWSSDYKKEFFEGLSGEYKKQSFGDKKIKRFDLSSRLEVLADSVSFSKEFIKNGDGNEKTPIKSAWLIAKGFGFTNYFFQKEFFYLLKEDMSSDFNDVFKSVNRVCKSCEQHMYNPYLEHSKNY